MLKNFVLTIPLAAMVTATAAVADTSNATVVDRYKEITKSVPYTKRDCVMVDVPVYGTQKSQGNAAEGALLGMILGGIGGKVLTGDDGGAAAGAVIGGLVGADKGSKPKHDQVVIGYREEQRCTDVTYYREETITVYSHSIVEFEHNGLTYSLPFDR